MRKIFPLVCTILLLAGCAGDAINGRPTRGDAAAAGAVAGASIGIATKQPLLIPILGVGGAIIGWLAGADTPPPPDCTLVEEVETDAAIIGNRELPQAGNHYRRYLCQTAYDRNSEQMPPRVPITTGTPTSQSLPKDFDSVAWHEKMVAERTTADTLGAAYRGERCKRAHGKEEKAQWCS